MHGVKDIKGSEGFNSPDRKIWRGDWFRYKGMVDREGLNHLWLYI